MGNTCPGSKVSGADEAALLYAQHDRIKIQPIVRSGKYSQVTDSPPTEKHKPSIGGSHGGHGAFYSTFDPTMADAVSLAVLVEHYQPYEFPICPVLNSDTQRLVRDSWHQIIQMEFDSSDVGSGKVSGASYFYVRIG